MYVEFSKMPVLRFFQLFAKGEKSQPLCFGDFCLLTWHTSSNIRWARFSSPTGWKFQLIPALDVDIAEYVAIGDKVVMCREAMLGVIISEMQSSPDAERDQATILRSCQLL